MYVAALIDAEVSAGGAPLIEMLAEVRVVTDPPSPHQLPGPAPSEISTCWPMPALVGLRARVGAWGLGWVA